MLKEKTSANSVNTTDEHFSLKLQCTKDGVKFSWKQPVSYSRKHVTILQSGLTFIIKTILGHKDFIFILNC